MEHRLWRKITVFFVFIALLLVPLQGAAEDAELCNIKVTNTRDDLLLYFNVKNFFTKDVKKAILDGVSTKFTFFIYLYAVRNFWPDEKLAELEIHHTIKYDNLKNEFTIIRSEHSAPIVVKSIVKSQQIMASVDDLKIISLKKLSKGRQYQIRMKAELDEDSLPFYLHHYLLFFISWNIETDWHTIDFIY